MENAFRTMTALPCFSPQALSTPKCTWLAVSPGCNLECSYCFRDRYGGTDRTVRWPVLSPEVAVQKVMDDAEVNGLPGPAVIWGPGEPLLAASTFVVLRQLSWRYPEMDLTVATNGLLLPDRLDDLVRSGVRRLVVSVNALTPDTASLIYGSASYRARTYTGRDAGELVLQQQWNGLSDAMEAGLDVTVFTAVMAGVNDGESDAIRHKAGSIGVERVVTANIDLPVM